MSAFYINKLLSTRSYYYNYTDLPEEYQNEAFYLKAIREGVNIRSLPEKRELYIEAVKLGLSPIAVPARFRDAAMCKTYVQNCTSPDLSGFKQSVLNSPGLWMELIRMNFKVAAQVPKSQVTQDLVDFAVSQDGSLLGTFQKRHRLVDTCLAAIQSPGWCDSCIVEIPPEHRNKEVCKAFMEKAKNICLAIDYIPTALRSEQCLKFYARRDGNIIPKFPKRLWSNQIWEMGVASFAERPFQWSTEFLANCPEDLKMHINKIIDEEKRRIEEKELRRIIIRNLLSVHPDDQESISSVLTQFPKASPELKEQEFEDPVTMDSLQEGQLYAFFVKNEKIFFAGSLTMFQTFISMGQNGSTINNVLIPLLNKLTPTSELEWVIW
jgi:hypothetical protein